MDGGKAPIHDGDWVVLRWARGDALKNIDKKVALIENRDAIGEAGYQLKRVVREGGRWLLRSNNPDVPDFEASEETKPIAVLRQVIRPEDLAPPVGSFFQETPCPRPSASTSRSADGHVGGHLFFLVKEPGAFKAPDRLARPASRQAGGDRLRPDPQRGRRSLALLRGRTVAPGRGALGLPDTGHALGNGSLIADVAISSCWR